MGKNKGKNRRAKPSGLELLRKAAAEAAVSPVNRAPDPPDPPCSPPDEPSGDSAPGGDYPSHQASAEQQLSAASPVPATQQVSAPSSPDEEVRVEQSQVESPLPSDGDPAEDSVSQLSDEAEPANNNPSANDPTGNDLVDDDPVTEAAVSPDDDQITDPGLDTQSHSPTLSARTNSRTPSPLHSPGTLSPPTAGSVESIDENPLPSAATALPPATVAAIIASPPTASAAPVVKLSLGASTFVSKFSAAIPAFVPRNSASVAAVSAAVSAAFAESTIAPVTPVSATPVVPGNNPDPSSPSTPGPASLDSPLGNGGPSAELTAANGNTRPVAPLRRPSPPTGLTAPAFRLAVAKPRARPLLRELCNCAECKMVKNGIRPLVPDFVEGFVAATSAALLTRLIKAVVRVSEVSSVALPIQEVPYRPEFAFAAITFDVSNHQARKARLDILRYLILRHPTPGQVINPTFIKECFNRFLVGAKVLWKGIFYFLLEHGLPLADLVPRVLFDVKLMFRLINLHKLYHFSLNGTSLIGACVQRGHLPTAIMLWRANFPFPDIDKVRTKCPSLVKNFTEGATQDVMMYTQVMDSCGRYLIHYAAHNLQVSALVGAAVVNAQDQYGCTPLFLAVRSLVGHGTRMYYTNYFQTIKTLLTAGADPNIPDYCGRYPLALVTRFLVGAEQRLRDVQAEAEVRRDEAATQAYRADLGYATITLNEYRRVFTLLVKSGAYLAYPEEDSNFIAPVNTKAQEASGVIVDREAALRYVLGPDDDDALLDTVIQTRVAITPPGVVPITLEHPQRMDRRTEMMFPIFDRETKRHVGYEHYLYSS